ncbi:hypothetical protein T439DRAFT_324075 [Meredithblackwellia eburnea MCA 4105]
MSQENQAGSSKRTGSTSSHDQLDSNNPGRPSKNDQSATAIDIHPLRNGKRRRIEPQQHQPSSSPSSAARSSPPSLSPSSFHLSLQESLFSRLLVLSTTLLELTDDGRRLSSELQLLKQQRKTHQERMAASLESMNQTLAAAAQLTAMTRRLSVQAIGISTDVRTFLGRYMTMTIPNDEDGDTWEEKKLRNRDEMSKSAKEIFEGPLFEGLFEGIEFDEDKDHDRAWADLVASVPANTNSSQIASSWTEIFTTFDPPQHLRTGPSQFPLAYLAYTHAFRGQIMKIIKVVAVEQLTKMARIDRELTDLGERGSLMRDTNMENWKRYQEIEDEYRCCKRSLEQNELDWPKTEEKVLDHVLQLVILARRT